MNNEYKKLENAINNGELKEYLVSDYRYRTITNPGIDVMNDFYTITYNLNEYGIRHPGFDKFLIEEIKKILNENKIYYTYSIVNIIKEQMELELNKKSKINFVNSEILNLIKKAILSRKEELSKIQDYEGGLKPNGFMGVYNEWDNKVYEETGKHIL